MSAFKSYSFSLLFVLIAAMCSSCGREKSDDKKKPVPTPEQAVRQFNEAVKAGDIDAALAALTKESRKLFEEYRASIIQSTTFTKVIQDAYDERFGKEPGAEPESVADINADFMYTWFSNYWRIEILGKEIKTAEKVDFKVRLASRPYGEQKETTTLEDKISVVKEDGAWKLRLPEVDRMIEAGQAAQDGPEPEVAMAQMKAMNEEFAKQVREGKYATREQAGFAYAAELYRTIGKLEDSNPGEKTKK